MKYTIIHDLPGRIRVQCHAVRIDPGCRVRLTRWVTGHADLVSASLSARTGNLLVVYAGTAERESILRMLDELQLFGVASIDGGEKRAPRTIAEAATDAAAKVCPEMIVHTLLPRPAQKIMDGWKLGRGVCILADKLLYADLLAFAYAAGKFILFHFAGASLPLRVLLGTVANILEDAFSSLSPARIEYRREIKALPLGGAVRQDAI